jgi:transcriptional regulator with XRE-family HTH domain
MTIAAERGTADAAHRRRIGERLRRIRQQQGLSLADVQARSDGQWKAVVVGAYERGDRSVTVSRMRELADFYNVPVTELLPPTMKGTEARGNGGRVVLNLEPLHAGPGDAAADPDGLAVGAIARFARRIQHVRGDHNGRVLTIRGNDVTTIASAIGSEPDDLLDVLRRRGIVGQVA